jgi:hypothetical protein
LAIGDRNGLTIIEEGEAPNLDRVSLSLFSMWREGCANVFMKTLDSFIEEEKIHRVDFIRMDVEGFEYRIIKGMKATLQRFSPKLFIEIHPRMMHEYYGDRFEDFLRELSQHAYIVKYAVWEPLTPIYLHTQRRSEWKIVKDLKPEDILRYPSLCRDWIRLFLEKR